MRKARHVRNPKNVRQTHVAVNGEIAVTGQISVEEGVKMIAMPNLNVVSTH
jgi:hypothetical protein